MKPDGLDWAVVGVVVAVLGGLVVVGLGIRLFLLASGL